MYVKMRRHQHTHAYVNNFVLEEGGCGLCERREDGRGLLR